jgi:hypothetical protein
MTLKEFEDYMLLKTGVPPDHYYGVKVGLQAGFIIGVVIGFILGWILV